MQISAVFILLAIQFLIGVTVCEGDQKFKMSGKRRMDNIKKSGSTTRNKRIKPRKLIKNAENKQNSFSFEEDRKIKVSGKRRWDNTKKSGGTRTNQGISPKRLIKNAENKQQRRPVKNVLLQYIEHLTGENTGSYNTKPKKNVHLNSNFGEKKINKVEMNPIVRPAELFKNTFARRKEVKQVACSKDPEEIFLSAGDSYLIRTPGYPYPYGKWKNCGWYFSANKDVKGLKLECENFWLRKENKKSKCHDVMLLSDGFALTGQCGQNNPTGLQTLTGFLDVWFRSGGKKNPKFFGFSCKVTAERNPPPTIKPPIEPPKPPTVDKSCRCGRINKPTKIVGGQESGENEYPWLAAMVNKGTSTVFCGAAIINTKWIITAAHCTDYILFSEVPYQVLVGAHSTTNPSKNEKRLNPIKIVQHADYDYANVIHDISLIQIPTLTFSSDNAVAPICLPDPANLYEDTDNVVAGWGTLTFGGGQPEVLMDVTVTSITNSLCEKSYPGEIKKTMLCAGGKGGKDACQGDSGGPLITSAGNHHVIIGVVSWGRGCAMAGYPGVYTRITEYLDWINEVVNSINEDVTVCAV